MRLTLIISLLLLANLRAENTTNISVRVLANHERVYLNQEIILSIELRTSLRLHNGNLSKPELNDAIIEPLVEDDQKELLENGARVMVFRRVYAIYPKKAGELLIPALSFEGTVVDNSSRGMLGFFSSGRHVTASSEPLKIKVDDIPASYPAGQPFLALKSLAIIESFDDPEPQFKINQATTRRFEIKALGTVSSFVPLIDPPKLAGLQVYSESGERSNKKSEEGMEASLSFSHVYMPSAAGPINVPERLVYWWDTEKNELRTTVIRALSFNARGDSAAPLKIPDQKTPAISKEQSSEQIKANYWPWLAGLLALLWLATLILYLRKKSPAVAKQAQIDDLAAIKDRLLKALTRENRRACYVALGELKKLALKNHEYSWILVIVEPMIAKIERGLYGDHEQVSFSSIKQILSQLNPPADAKAALPKFYPH